MGKDLARRVAEQAGDQNVGLVPGKTPDDPAQGRFKTLSTSIRQMAPEFALAMPEGVDPMQLVRDAITEARRNPKLLECDQESVLGSLMTIAQLGLRCAVLGHAWPVPFWDRKAVRFDDNGRERTGGYRAQMIMGYQGWRELVWRSGLMKGNDAREVREHDFFDYEYGDNAFLRHKPARQRGEVTDYYAVLRYLNGGSDFEVMSLDEVCAHRDRFASTKTKEGKVFGVWVEHFDGMARKTPYLKVVRRGPKTRMLELAAAADETVRTDHNPQNDSVYYGERPEIGPTPVPEEPTASDELWREVVAVAPGDWSIQDIERDIRTKLSIDPKTASAPQLQAYMDILRKAS